MLTFAIAWELWLRTRSAFALGMVGLVQVVPVILLSLPGGHVADQHNRRRIVGITQVAFALCSLGLGLLSYFQGSLVLIYVCLLGLGIARAFNDPAASTLVPEAVPPELFASAATWTSSAWQLASIAGPAAAGIIIALWNNVTVIYLVRCAGGDYFSGLARIYQRSPSGVITQDRHNGLTDGRLSLYSGHESHPGGDYIGYVRSAVRWGGGVAADLRDRYFAGGPQGLGVMRAAPSIGAIMMAFAIAHLPPFKHAGKTLLIAVAGFGAATIIFGFSKNLLLSVAMLTLLGGLDNISVIIRSTLILTFTPDEMRGRTAAVNSIFVGTSNEMGAFESGMAASLFGPIIAVVAGGIGTILVVLTIAKVWPEMRNLKTLDVPVELSV